MFRRMVRERESVVSSVVIIEGMKCDFCGQNGDAITKK